MNTKKTISKIFLAVCWLMAGGGLLVLLIAAIGRKNTQQCTGYEILIKGDKEDHFIEEKEVVEWIAAGTHGKIKGKAIREFNLMRLENFLEDNVWIRDAELYFDNKNMLHISIQERQPLARIFTIAGKSYYIDSSMAKMPLSDNHSARVPVFTNVPDRKFWTAKDSILMKSIRETALFISNDPFWMAQVAQVDINRNNEFELIPTIGNHVVQIGNSDDLDKKFHRLFVFYEQVLKKTGFDKYRLVNVAYSGQVIATGRGKSNTEVDSVQLRANVLKLLQKSKEVQAQAEKDMEKAFHQVAVQPLKQERNTAHVKTGITDKTKRETGKDPTVQKRVPKAVMPKRNNH